MVWHDIYALKRHLDWERSCGIDYDQIALTSGGFDPLHVGHVRCLVGSSRLAGRLVVVVNGDGFLLRKKGYVFMPLTQRLEMVAAIRGVDHVVSWDDGTQNVSGALAILKPQLFTKGGDRRNEQSMDPEELSVCASIGCKMVYGVGGFDKPQSSSKLVEQARSRS